MYAYEKEIVMYAYFKKLDYFSTECIYSPNAYRGYARTFLKDLEAIRPSTIVDIIQSGQNLKISSVVKQSRKTELQNCVRCGYISSNTVCKACILLEGLEKGTPQLGSVAKSRERSKTSHRQCGQGARGGGRGEEDSTVDRRRTQCSTHQHPSLCSTTTQTDLSF